MEDGHSKTVDETLNYFGTDLEKGLSLDQIKRNQEKYGPNGEYRFLFIFISIHEPKIENKNSLIFSLNKLFGNKHLHNGTNVFFCFVICRWINK